MKIKYYLFFLAQRVFLSIFLCFFLRIFLRLFLITELNASPSDSTNFQGLPEIIFPKRINKLLL